MDEGVRQCNGPNGGGQVSLGSRGEPEFLRSSRVNLSLAFRAKGPVGWVGPSQNDWQMSPTRNLERTASRWESSIYDVHKISTFSCIFPRFLLIILTLTQHIHSFLTLCFANADLICGWSYTKICALLRTCSRSTSF